MTEPATDPPTGLHRVRTTMQPWLDLYVNDTEYLDLERQGLLLPDDQNQLLIAEKAAAAAEPAAKKKGA